MDGVVCGMSHAKGNYLVCYLSMRREYLPITPSLLSMVLEIQAAVVSVS